MIGWETTLRVKSCTFYIEPSSNILSTENLINTIKNMRLLSQSLKGKHRKKPRNI
jgi:hypothetical protein